MNTECCNKEMPCFFNQIAQHMQGSVRSAKHQQLQCSSISACTVYLMRHVQCAYGTLLLILYSQVLIERICLLWQHDIQYSQRGPLLLPSLLSLFIQMADCSWDQTIRIYSPSSLTRTAPPSHIPHPPPPPPPPLPPPLPPPRSQNS